MNNFKEANFSQSQSSFFPKKSFNKIVNLNLLNSKEFVENFVKNPEDPAENKERELNNFIKKSMKFYCNKYLIILNQTKFYFLKNISKKF
jgi:hypothetical protein